MPGQQQPEEAYISEEDMPQLPSDYE